MTGSCMYKVLIFTLIFMSYSISGYTFANGPLSHVEYSTYVGGSGIELVNGHQRGGMANDSNGNIYIIGTTQSSADYPTTAGSVFPVYQGGSYDCVISKFDPTLTTLLASTYIGGSGDDRCSDIDIDADDNVWATMRTSSDNLPTQSTSYDTVRNGWDSYIVKLNNNLSTVMSSTYLGGTGTERYSPDLEIASDGSIYIAGTTNSSNFPIVGGSYQPARAGGREIYVAHLDDSLTNLLDSTYLGGTSTELYNTTLTIDNNQNIVVRGHSLSTNYPTTAGVYQTSSAGGYDIVLSRLDPTLSTLMNSTYLGGSSHDYAAYYGGQVVFDTNNDLYVVGSTVSSDYPITSGAYDSNFAGNNEIIISKLNEDFSTLQASTFVGGAAHDFGSSIEVLPNGNLVFMGSSSSSVGVDGGPSFDAYDSVHNGRDNVLGVISPDLTVMDQLTYVGGINGSDYNYEIDESIIVDGECIYFTASSTSRDFPLSTGSGDVPYQSSVSGSWDYTITKMCPASCGDNVVQQFDGEECDDEKNGIQNDGCNDECLIPINGSCGSQHNNNIYDFDNAGDSLSVLSLGLCNTGDATNFQFLTGSTTNSRSWECEGTHLGSVDVNCSAVEEYCGDTVINGVEECDEGGINTINCTDQCKKPVCGDGIVNGLEECDGGERCDSFCKIGYCRDDAPIIDTSKNFVVTKLSETSIEGVSEQPNSEVTICIEDNIGSRDIFYTMTDSLGSFFFVPNFSPYTPNRVNIGVMLHDENGLDIDHHALIGTR